MAVLLERDANGSNQDRSSAHDYEVETTGFTIGLDDKCGRRRGVSDDPKVSDLRKWATM